VAAATGNDDAPGRREEKRIVLNEPTIEKLKALRLDALCGAWAEQQKSPEIGQRSFDERLGLLVDAKHLARENKRLGRLLKEAKLLLGQACVEEIDDSPKRELDKAVVRQPATCRWVHEHQNVIVTGATGVGKTCIACALAQQVCRRGFGAICRRASRRFDELGLAPLTAAPSVCSPSWPASTRSSSRLGLHPRDQERRNLLEILEDRCGQRSTIVTSQLPSTSPISPSPTPSSTASSIRPPSSVITVAGIRANFAPSRRGCRCFSGADRSARPQREHRVPVGACASAMI
jgi:hypothetical protein